MAAHNSAMALIILRPPPVGQTRSGRQMNQQMGNCNAVLDLYAASSSAGPARKRR